jgi:hypothetical protein
MAKKANKPMKPMGATDKNKMMWVRLTRDHYDILCYEMKMQDITATEVIKKAITAYPHVDTLTRRSIEANQQKRLEQMQLEDDIEKTEQLLAELRKKQKELES